MTQASLERWKRRVGRHHWDENEDEFVSLTSSTFDAARDTLAIVETTLIPFSSEARTNLTLVIYIMLSLVVVSMGLLLVRHWRCLKTTRTKLTKSHDREQNARRETSDCQGEPSSQSSVCTREIADRAGEKHAEEQPAVGSDAAASKQSHADVTCATDKDEEHLPKECKTAIAMLTTNATTAGTLDLPVTQAPLLVTEHTEIITVSSSRSSTGAPCVNKSVVSDYQGARSSIAALAQDASDLAQSIRVTQAVFCRHGLDTNLAAEWAMRRQASELSEASRREAEDRRLIAEILLRREDRRVSKRQFRAMKSSLEYDADWLEKILIARNGCLYACLYSLYGCVIAALAFELYWRITVERSIMLFVTTFLGCNCSHATATDVSSDSSIWRATWMSDYCKGTLYSWASASVSLPFCFALCICRRVVPALFIQAGLHFCRCPTFIHQTVTLSFISSLLYTQLSVPLSEFVWCRVIPMSVVTLAFVARILVFAAQTVGGLQKAKDDFRNLLEQALISFDYLYSSIILTQLFAMGLLLAVSPRMSP